MSIYCRYCHRLVSRVHSRIGHDKRSCQSSGHKKQKKNKKAKQHGIQNGREMGEVFLVQDTL